MQFNNTIRLSKTPQMQGPDEQTLRLIHDFVCFAKEKLELPTDELIQIKLLGANPKEPIATGAFDPSSKKYVQFAKIGISLIMQEQLHTRWYI